MTALPPVVAAPKRQRGVMARRSTSGQSVSPSHHAHDANAPRCVEHPPLHLHAARDQFIDANAAGLCPARTIPQYSWTLNMILKCLAGRDVQDVSGITPQLIRQFLTALSNRGCSSSYIHGYARVIRTWLRFLESEGLIPVNPMTRVTMPRVERKILPTFSRDEIERLLRACSNKRERAMVLILLDTGCRAAEMVHITLKDVDLDAGKVVIRQGKGRRDRIVFLRPLTIESIQENLTERTQLEDDAPLFPSAKTGKPLTANGLLQLCRRLGRRSGVPNCHPHKFRRTFATWSLRAGMNIHAVQRLMGHADLDTLLRYLDLGEADLAEAHRLYGPVDSLLGAMTTPPAVTVPAAPVCSSRRADARDERTAQRNL